VESAAAGVHDPSAPAQAFAVLAAIKPGGAKKGGN
jgi:hypothetical protein